MDLTLVTGASGFVGSNLVRMLVATGRRVCCLVRGDARPPLLAGCDVELVRGALDDGESLQAAAAGATTVFHVAGRTAALTSEQYQLDNVDGTARLLKACAAAATPPTVVAVSSLAAGGPGTDAAPRRETDPEFPISVYGRSKLAAERAAAEFAAAVPISVVRPPLVFGPADRASLALYASLRFLPFHLTPGFGGFPLSAVYVGDLCDALLRVAAQGERLAPGGEVGRGVYYVATDRTITYGQLGRLAGDAAKLTAVTLPMPRFVFWIAGALGDGFGRWRGRPALINLDKVREATAAGWVCDDGKIRRTLGYRPTGALEERFAETVAWYKENGWL